MDAVERQRWVVGASGIQAREKNWRKKLFLHLCRKEKCAEFMWSTNNNMNANLTCNTKKPVHPYEGASFLKRWTFWWVFLYLRSIFGVYSDFFFLSKLAACAQVAQRLIQIGPSATNWKWRHLSYVKRTWINETLWPLRNTMGWRTQQETSASIHRYTTSLCKENHRRKHTFYGHRCDIKVCVCVCVRLDM